MPEAVAPANETDPAAPTPAARRRNALLGRVRSRTGGSHRHLLTGSTVLVVGAAVQGLGGMIFSLIVAQTDAKADFGDATALFTSTLFVTYLAGLGLPVALARYAADDSRDSHVIFTWGAAATMLAAVVASGGYLGLVHPRAADVLWNWHPIGGFVVFALIVAGSAASLIVDVRAMTMRRWSLVLVRIVVVAVAKIALISVGTHSSHRSLLLFVALGGPVALSGFVGLALLPRVTGGSHRWGPRPTSARPATRYAGINYLSTLAYQAPYFALPVIVLVNVDSTINSSFYVAWGIVSIAFYVPSAIGQALLAEGGKDGAQLQSQLRLALALAVALMAVGSLVAFLGKSVVVAAYGEAYRDAAHILPAMMLAGVPWALTSLLLTEARVQHRNGATVVITTVLTVAIVVPALILVPRAGPNGGINGASRAWLLGNVVAALVAVVVTVASRRQASARPPEVPDLDPVVA